ncbi:MAG: HAD-IC family P-type ATPase, partial [Patescibacteria group bacterium]
PFDPQRKRVSKIVRKGFLRELIVLGAPDELIKLIKQQPSATQELTKWITEQGKIGKRVLLVTTKTLATPPISIEKAENGMIFLGAISFIDPIKPTTFAAISQARALGVKIKILTGDSKEVSGNVALQIGLIKNEHEVITGDEFKELSPAQQLAVVDKFSVFARVTPQLKYKIVKLLEQKQAVGFLGEGINDAPALKVANVALVVAHASDIAKEAADIVLLKRSLHVVIEGIREGRNVFVNTTKYITATLAANFGNFFAVSIASLLIEYLPMLPLQILLVNLLSDFPMIAIATDHVDTGSSYQPSRFNFRQFALTALILGAVSTLFDFVFFGIFVHSPAPVLQTAWFMGSIMTELLFIFSVRTRLLFFRASRPSITLMILTFVAFVITLLLPYITISQQIFAFQPLTFKELSTVITIVCSYFITTEIVKLFYYKFVKQ